MHLWTSEKCQIWKRRAPENDEDPSNKIPKIMDMRPISAWKHEWIFPNMVPISIWFCLIWYQYYFRRINGLINTSKSMRKYMGTSLKNIIFAYMDFKKMSNLEKTGTEKWWRSVQEFLENLGYGSNIYIWKHEIRIW